MKKNYKNLFSKLNSFSDVEEKSKELTTTVSETKDKGNCDSVTVVADDNDKSENKVNTEVVNESEVLKMDISTKDFSELVNTVKVIGNEVLNMKKQFAESEEEKEDETEETVEVPVSLLNEVKEALEEANDKVEEAVEDEPKGEETEDTESEEIEESCHSEEDSDFEEFAEKVTCCIEDLSNKVNDIVKRQNEFMKQFSNGVGDVTADKSDVAELAEGADKKDDEFVVEKKGKEEIVKPEPTTETKIVTETKVDAPKVNKAPAVIDADNFSDRYQKVKNMFNF